MKRKNKKIVAGMMAGFCVLSTQSVLGNFSKLPMRGGNGLISYAMVNGNYDKVSILNDYNNDGEGEYFLENKEATLEATLIGVFNKDMTNFEIPKYVKKGDVLYPVTKIKANDGVFHSYLNLKTISIPSTVQSIDSDDNYFKCQYLEAIYVDPYNPNYRSIDGDLYSKDCTHILRYANCKQSVSYIMPSSVKKVCNGAFYNACYLKNIALSSSLETIGDDAFNRCEGLIGIKIPENVIKVGKGAFGNLGSLQEISMPDGVTDIPELLFVNCHSLNTINLSPYTTSIGKQAFDHCFALTKMVLPLSLESVGNYAFSDCYNLEQVYIDRGNVAIGYGVFYKCVKLASINIHSGAPCKGRLIEMELGDKIVEH